MNYLINRSQLEQQEEKTLASFAIKNTDSQGRDHQEQQDDFRLDFQRDRDRILHSKAFRRLKGKTQVFVAHHGDHFRSRLSHTLEVAQIARSLARNLALNEDLAETIALAHDLGHTPFGHAGEKAMNEIMQKFNSEFEHNNQSRRVVEFLEDKNPNYKGLNLTYETREGLQKHRTPYDLVDSNLTQQSFLEAQIVDLADEIAYQNHDTDDGLNAHIISKNDFQKLDIYKLTLQTHQIYNAKFTISNMIDLMVRDALNQIKKNLEKIKPKTANDIRQAFQKIADFSPEIKKANNQLRKFLFTNFYQNPIVFEQSNKGEEIVKQLFDFYFDCPQRLPNKYQDKIQSGERKEIVIKDFIAGMTDDYVLMRRNKRF